MIGQLLIARPIIAIVLGKATIFHRCLNGHRVDNTKWTLLDFNFSLLRKEEKKKKAENSGSRRVREQERGGVSGGRWSEG